MSRSTTNDARQLAEALIYNSPDEIDGRTSSDKRSETYGLGAPDGRNWVLSQRFLMDERSPRGQNILFCQ